MNKTEEIEYYRSEISQRFSMDKEANKALAAFIKSFKNIEMAENQGQLEFVEILKRNQDQLRGELKRIIAPEIVSDLGSL